MDVARNLSDTLNKLGVQHDRDRLLEEVSELKGRPDWGRRDDELLMQATVRVTEEPELATA